MEVGVEESVRGANTADSTLREVALFADAEAVEEVGVGVGAGSGWVGERSGREGRGGFGDAEAAAEGVALDADALASMGVVD